MATVKFWQDDMCESPRDWDGNRGTIVYHHPRYKLGDEDLPASEVVERIEGLHKGRTVVLPVYLYDHSGITISTSPFSCRWDSGQVGFIYAERVSPNPKARAKVVAGLEAEIEILDAYIRGDCWGFSIVEDDGVPNDSCGGFLCLRGKDKEALAAMLDCMAAEYHDAAKAAWEKRFDY
jgi:hypothetical protein